MWFWFYWKQHTDGKCEWHDSYEDFDSKVVVFIILPLIQIEKTQANDFSICFIFYLNVFLENAVKRI